MKFILIYTVCSFISMECLPEQQHIKVFDSWNDCIITGLDTIKETVELFPKEYINEHHVGGRYVCKQVNSI